MTARLFRDVEKRRICWKNARSQTAPTVELIVLMRRPASFETETSWYLVSTEDKMIPPAAQRAMSKRASSTVVEVKGSHAVYVSQPQAVASLIEKAAKGAAETAQ